MTLPTSHNEAGGEKQLVLTDLGQEKKESVGNSEPVRVGVGKGRRGDLAGAVIKINVKCFQVFRGKNFRGGAAKVGSHQRPDARRKNLSRSVYRPADIPGRRRARPARWRSAPGAVPAEVRGSRPARRPAP